MSKKYKISLSLFAIFLLAILVELLRSTFSKSGDFIGYVLVGNYVLDGENIYTDSLINTWPPFFSIVSVPIAIIDNFSQEIVRFLWLSGSLIAMYGIINYLTLLTTGKTVTLFPIKSNITISENKISFIHWIVLLPLIISLRYILENLNNIQINIYMLFFALSSIYFYTKNKNLASALLLSFSISIKVYTVFLLLYFLFKREFKLVGLTILFCLGFALVPFLVFGYEQTIEYYTFWYKNSVEPLSSIGHKNQSVFAMIRSLISHESRGINQPLNEEIYINIFNFPLENIKLISYALIGFSALPVMFLFRKKITERTGLKSFIEYALVLNVIPILSPLAWKAYFIFLFPSYFLNYLFIYQYKNQLSKRLNFFIKVNYYASIILTVFSSELFTGKYFSDIMELFASITIGSILIAINLLIFFSYYHKFEKKYSSS